MILNCPECGRKISHSARCCPRCGMSDAGRMAWYATNEGRAFLAKRAEEYRKQSRIQRERREAEKRGYRAEQREEAIKNALVAAFWIVVIAIGIAVYYAITH